MLKADLTIFREIHLISSASAALVSASTNSSFTLVFLRPLFSNHLIDLVYVHTQLTIYYINRLLLYDIINISFQFIQDSYF